jgi:hypothetical protein
MSPLITCAALAFIGTALAFAAGCWGGFLGGLLLIGAAIFITTAGYVIGSEAYDKGVHDAIDDDIYD